MAKSSGSGNPTLVELGKRIAARRKALRMSQLDLSLDTGIAKSHICDYEKGRKNLSLLTLKRIANALDIPVSTLIEGL